MTGSAALYQVAVALIPALLFGGATLQLRDESPNLGGNKVAGAIVSLIILAGVFAEIVAIRGAIDPNLRDFEQRYLVLVLTLGTAGVAFWIAAPLLTKEASGEGDNGAGEVRRHPDAVPRGVLAALLIAVGFFGQIAITDSLHSSAARAQFDEVAKQRVRIEHEMRAAEGNDSDSRAHLIALARSTNAAAPVVHIVLARLARLDGKALSVAHEKDIDVENVEQRMNGAFRVLTNTDKSLKRSFKHRVADLDRGERELLLLAEKRVISAVHTEMIADVNDTISLERLASACESVGLSNCRPETVKRTTVLLTTAARAGSKAHRTAHRRAKHHRSHPQRAPR